MSQSRGVVIALLLLAFLMVVESKVTTRSILAEKKAQLEQVNDAMQYNKILKETVERFGSRQDNIDSYVQQNMLTTQNFENVEKDLLLEIRTLQARCDKYQGDMCEAPQTVTIISPALSTSSVKPTVAPQFTNVPQEVTLTEKPVVQKPLDSNSTFTCFGLKSTDKKVCNGNGVCTKKDTCLCNKSHSGKDCTEAFNPKPTKPDSNSTFTCFGIKSTDKKVCNGNGVCTKKDTCLCNKSHSGKDCTEAFNPKPTKPNEKPVVQKPSDSNSTFTCFGLKTTDKKVCNGNGVCTKKDTCLCNKSHSGKDCTEAFNPKPTKPTQKPVEKPASKPANKPVVDTKPVPASKPASTTATKPVPVSKPASKPASNKGKN